LIAAIVVGGALIVGMALRDQGRAWAWMLLLGLYVPALLVATGVLKFLVLRVRRARPR